MRFRKLRIAWSVMWGVTSVLLCAMWLNSYQSATHVWFSVIITSNWGSIYLHMPQLHDEDDKGPHIGMWSEAAGPEPDWPKSRIRIPYFALVAGSIATAVVPLIGFRCLWPAKRIYVQPPE
jgi:hypothetical protein